MHLRHSKTSFIKGFLRVLFEIIFQDDITIICSRTDLDKNDKISASQYEGPYYTKTKNRVLYKK